MLLKSLGISEARGDDEAVAILVGPNGSGKSNHLLKIAHQYRDDRSILILCNAAYDRFAGLRDVNKISAGRGGNSPRNVIKRAVSTVLDSETGEFYKISSILEYCGYQPRLGFMIEEVDTDRPPKTLLSELLESDDHFLSDPERYDIETARRFFTQPRHQEVIWIDQRESILKFSQGREFAAVLRRETLLRRAKALKKIHVYLERNDGVRIDLHNASSGELSLISSLVFLVTQIRGNAIVIIDEPENSLHPSWQREYVDKILAAVQYNAASIIIATHAPLIVTGAIAKHPSLVTVHQIVSGKTQNLDIDGSVRGPNGIEEILWKAFEVVTPANHFVSEKIIDAIAQFERNEMVKADVLALVDQMDEKSFDVRQKQFFAAIRELLDKVEASKNEPGPKERLEPDS